MRLAFLLGLLLGVGFDTLSGGAVEAPEEAPGLAFSGGVQFLPRMKSEEDSRLEVNSVYD